MGFRTWAGQRHEHNICQGGSSIRKAGLAHASTATGLAGCDDEVVLTERLLNAHPNALLAEARALRDRSPVNGGHGSGSVRRRRSVTFSPKVFLPLTRLCRDSCGYCTFAQPPRPGTRAFMTLDEMLAVAEIGASQGCTEALFTLGRLATALGSRAERPIMLGGIMLGGIMLGGITLVILLESC